MNDENKINSNEEPIADENKTELNKASENGGAEAEKEISENSAPENEASENGASEKSVGEDENTKAEEVPEKAEGTVSKTASEKAPASTVAKKNEAAKKKTAAIVITACVIGVVVTVLGIIGIIKLLVKNPDAGDVTASTTLPSSSDGSFVPNVSENVSSSTGENESTEGTADASIYYIPNTTKKHQSTSKKDDTGNTTAVQQTIEGLPPLEKTGDNILSDRPDNEFIMLVAEKYNLPTENLVAIYAVPDSGQNFVLEFSGKKDSEGNVIKSPDTLKRVHQVDKDRNISTATGSIAGNVGVNYAEGMLVFYMVTNLVMPQYPDYFTGV